MALCPATSLLQLFRSCRRWCSTPSISIRLSTRTSCFPQTSLAWLGSSPGSRMLLRPRLLRKVSPQLPSFLMLAFSCFHVSSCHCRQLTSGENKENNQGRFCFFLYFPFAVVHNFFVQGKRPRLSKETVDSDEEFADFLESSAKAAEACADCGPGHPLKSCPKETVVDTVRPFSQ